LLAKLTGKRQVVFLCIELQNKEEFQLPPFLIELPGSVKIGRWTMSRIFHKKLNTMKYLAQAQALLNLSPSSFSFPSF